MASSKYNAINAVLMSALILIAATSLPAMTSLMPENASTQTFAYASMPTDTTDCGEQMANDMHSKSSMLDNAKAIALAVQNSEYKSRIQGYVPQFNSIYNNWKFDTTNCKAIEWLSVNVVHSLYDADGNYIKNVVVTLDPSLTKALGVSEHVGAVYSNQDHLTNWAAMEYAGNSFTWPNPPSTNVWEAKASWTLPAVSKPTDVTNPCRTDTGAQKPCDLAIWPGLEDHFESKNTGDHIAQAGSDGKITCISATNCTTEYFFWYLFYTVGGTGSATQCTGFTLNPGNGVQAIVTSHGKTGGTATLYDASVINTSTGVGCGTTNVSFAMSSPKIAAFVNERAQYTPGVKATLAKFTSDAMTGTMYYGGSSIPISTPQSNGWYNQVRMTNPAINIDYPSVSGSTITFSYSGSSGTGS